MNLTVASFISIPGATIKHQC